MTLELDHTGGTSDDAAAATQTTGTAVTAQAPTAPAAKTAPTPNEPYRELRGAIARIDADDDPGEDSLSIDDARFASKLAVYEEWSARHSVPMPEKPDGTIHQYKIRQLLRHVAVERTPFVDQALADLSARHLAAAPTRHDPETEIDLALDDYEEQLALRGFGPPRLGADPETAARVRVAAEMGRRVADLDRTAMRRLSTLVALHALTPGPLVGTGKPKAAVGANPAVGPLLAAGLTTFADGLPEDPLLPGRPDLITIAEVAGVAVSDIVSGPGHRAAVDAAAAAKGLVPNPLVAARRYPWRDLIEWGRGRATEEYGVGQARKAVHALRGLLNIAGRTAPESDPVPLDLPEKFAKAIADDHRLFGPGWRRWMADWVRWNDGLRASRPLPASLALKLRILMAERNVSTTSLRRGLDRLKLRGDVRNWVAGLAIPTAASEAKLAAVAERLRVPLDVLKRDLREEWRKRYFESGPAGPAGKRLPFDFEERYDEEARLVKIEENAWRYDKQDTKYSRGLPSRHSDEYAIRFDDWPEDTKKAWEENWPKKSKAAGQRRIGDQQRRARGADGKLEKPPREVRETTQNIRRQQLEYVFGHWHLARDRGEVAAAAGRLRTSEHDWVPEGGLGIPRHLLKAALLALPDLVTAFTSYRARRAGSRNRSVTLALVSIANLLVPERGIVWKSPGMLADLEEFAAWWAEHPMSTAEGDFYFDIQAFRDDWRAAVAHTYYLIRDDVEEIQEAQADDEEYEESRNSFDSVRAYVEHDSPMEHYMVSVRSMLDRPPMNALARHVHTRDSVMALILVQTGLRTYNMLFTFDAGDGGPAVRRRGRNGKVLDPTIRREEVDGRVRWMINIPAGEFKNFYSPYFKGKRPFEQELADEDGLYERLEHYTTKSRPYLLRGRKSDAFFVSSAGNDFTEHYAGMNYRRVTGTYFIHNPDLGIGGVPSAMPHGMHAVRNVRATHIVKVTGDLHLAAWSIQDQVRTVERHYARFIPKDKVRLAEQVLAAARAAGRPTA